MATVKMLVVADWIFECQGPKKGPSLKIGDKIECRPDFAVKLARRGVAKVAEDQNATGHKPFPPENSQVQSEQDAEIEKIKRLVGDGPSGDAPSTTTFASGGENETSQTNAASESDGSDSAASGKAADSGAGKRK